MFLFINAKGYFRYNFFNVCFTKLVLQRFEGIFGGKIDKAFAFGEILVLSSFMSKASKVQDSDSFYLTLSLLPVSVIGAACLIRGISESSGL